MLIIAIDVFDPLPQPRFVTYIFIFTSSNPILAVAEFTLLEAGLCFMPLAYARTDLQQHHVEPVLVRKSLFRQNHMSKIAKKGRCSVAVASSHSALGFPLDSLSVLGFLELNLETTDLEPVVYFYKKWFIKCL